MIRTISWWHCCGKAGESGGGGLSLAWSLLFPKVACFLDCFLGSHVDATHIPPLKGTQLYFFELSLAYSTFELSKECGQTKSKVNILFYTSPFGQTEHNLTFRQFFNINFTSSLVKVGFTGWLHIIMNTYSMNYESWIRNTHYSFLTMSLQYKSGYN